MFCTPHERIKKMITTDTFLKIGSQHQICEDYIIEGDIHDLQYIILSDGCSSSKNTEMGARILCHLAKKYLGYRIDEAKNFKLDHGKMGSWIIHNAELIARQMGLPISCLDATLMVSYHYNGRVFVYAYGDGTVILKENNGDITVDSISFSNNAPYYLSYKIDPIRDKIYYENKNSMFFSEKTNHSELCTELAYDLPQSLAYSVEYYQSIFVCSDGIESFIRKDPAERDLISVFDIIGPLSTFKNYKGEFLKRRVKRALKSFDDDGITHADDLSIGVYLRTEDG